MSDQEEFLRYSIDVMTQRVAAALYRQVRTYHNDAANWEAMDGQGEIEMNNLLSDKRMVEIRRDSVGVIQNPDDAYEYATKFRQDLVDLLAHHDAMMDEVVKRIKDEIIESRGMEGTIRAFAHQNCLRIIADMKETK